MSKTQKQNLLALSIAALVASSVAAIAGVTTFNNDLVGKTLYLTEGEMCPGGCPSGQWCDYATHTCKASDYSQGSAPSTGTANTGTAGTSTATTSTTSGPTGLNCAGGTLATCQATCVQDGVTNRFCMGYCSNECPSPSTTMTGTSTAATVTDRCAYTHECGETVRCLIELGACGSPKTGEKPTCDAIKAAATARGVKSPAVNMETGMAYCDELKAAAVTPPPVVETPVPTFVPAVAPPDRGEDGGEFNIMQPTERTETEYDGFGLPEDGYERETTGDEGFGEFDDFSDRFHGGPGDFGFGEDMGFPMEDFSHFGDMYDMEFDPGMMQEGFDEYFGGFGPGMGGEFGGDFGGGFGGDDFGGMPEWMGDELENMKDMMRDMAENMCPELVEEIDDIEDFEGLEELGFRMQEECSGGMGMGGPDPEMMENAVKMLHLFADPDGPVFHALDVAQKYKVFTTGEVEEIHDILAQLGEKAAEADEACSDLPDLESEGDFFGLRGLLAQLFEDDEEEFDEGDEGDFGGDMREAFEACGEILDEALGAGPGGEDGADEGPGGLMGELEEVMKEPMEAAVEDGTIPQEEWNEVESRFEEAMADLGFEEEFDESFHEEEDFGGFDEEEEEEDEEFEDEDEEEDEDDFDL